MADKHSEHIDKPCVCKIFKTSPLVWKASGTTDAQGPAEYRCRVCGATAFR